MEDTIIRLREKANKLPFCPGVYIMRDKNDKVIYVGKSKSLKNRVSQYFHDSMSRDNKTQKMVSNVCNFDYILTDTDMEALTLENQLIKQHDPKYNIKLKDGKGYPYIKITLQDIYPKILMVRKRLNDGAKYFGPYSSVGAVFTIIKTINKLFGIATCNKKFPRDIGKVRPCLYHHMGQCIAPCTGNVTSNEYKDVFKDVVTFLRGTFVDTKRSLEEKMEYASENLMFEAAALYRDRIEALSKLWQRQKVVAAPDVEQDIIALYSDDVCSCIAVFYIRSGNIIDNEHFIFNAEQIIDEDNISSFLTELYLNREYIPKDIVLNFKLEENEYNTISQFISDKSEYKVKLRTPERGDIKSLCNMVYENAKHSALLYKTEVENDNKILVKLASMLSLEVLPERIEAYDVSNYGNENITAGMIVAENGKLKKSDYRVFKISSTNNKQDDYGAMCEAIERRLNHISENTTSNFSKMPDLILLDGGKGHVSTVKTMIKSMGIDVQVFGMVKDEFHKTRALTDEENEISIARDQSVFMFIYKLQEEVHRFTISKMDNAKRKTLKTSTLEKINGIGATKSKNLLSHFKSLAKIKEADKAELMQVKGISEKNADDILIYYRKV